MTIEVYKKSKKIVEKIEELTRYVDCIEGSLSENNFKPLVFSGSKDHSLFQIDENLNREMHEFFLSKFKPELEKYKKEFEEL
jgi:hypothetical protein